MENNFYRKIVLLTLLFIVSSCGTTFKVGVIPMLSCVLQNIQVVPKDSKPVMMYPNLMYPYIVEVKGVGESPELAIDSARKIVIDKYGRIPDTIFNAELFFNTKSKVSTVVGTLGYKTDTCK